MAEVYRFLENVLSCYQHGQHYFGFENGSESLIHEAPATIYGNTLNVGDPVKGFDSGKDRTSFILTSGYMTYKGWFDRDIVFEITEANKKHHQGNLFHQRPKWMLSFGFLGPESGLLMNSANSCYYDIHPHKIIKP